MIAAILILTMVATVTMTLASAQQQDSGIVVTAPNDTKLVDSKQIIEQIRTLLQNSRLKDYKLYENGTAEYTIQPLTIQGSPLKNITMVIKTEHNYTPEFGYIYNSSGIYTHNGDQKLVITTFE